MTTSTTVRFIDTNVLLYAISRDREERDKAQRANEILATRDIALSVQVLQEFYVQATAREPRSQIVRKSTACTVGSSLLQSQCRAPEFLRLRVRQRWCRRQRRQSTLQLQRGERPFCRRGVVDDWAPGEAAVRTARPAAAKPKGST